MVFPIPHYKQVDLEPLGDFWQPFRSGFLNIYEHLHGEARQEVEGFIYYHDPVFQGYFANLKGLLLEMLGRSRFHGLFPEISQFLQDKGMVRNPKNLHLINGREIKTDNITHPEIFDEGVIETFPGTRNALLLGEFELKPNLSAYRRAKAQMKSRLKTFYPLRPLVRHPDLGTEGWFTDIHKQALRLVMLAESPEDLAERGTGYPSREGLLQVHQVLPVGTTLEEIVRLTILLITRMVAVDSKTSEDIDKYRLYRKIKGFTKRNRS